VDFRFPKVGATGGWPTLMDRRTIFPQFQKATGEYNKLYFDNMVNALNGLMNVLRSPGEGRQTTMTLTNLPTNDYGLEVGGMFQVDGVVHVSILNKAYVGGVGGTTHVGTVSVTLV